MLIDDIKIVVVSGKGGDGRVSFTKHNKADGGDGGDGGDVILQGSRNVYDLRSFKTKKKYKAENGEMGGRNVATGKNGADLIIKVPLTTRIFSDTDEILATISEHDQQVPVVEGGRGGMGNYFYRTRGLGARHKAGRGEPALSANIRLELNLIADVILLGLPNVGKSSLLNELTNAKAKTASYQFTTLEPSLARMDELMLMDLPGLIEGTVSGKGVGDKFLKHAKTARLKLHVLAADRQDLLADYRLISSEIESLDADLNSMPELIVISKADELDTKELAQLQSKLRAALKLDYSPLAVTILNEKSLQELKQQIKQKFKRQFAHD